ncbi:hypothetical protein POM88_045411 [Heracleum sosnowskyi]|uniref:Uncharacterized protein n=1 Tax=Heracleum sosnowskyi TaxID=360622 RepID=A0AAD8H4H2_9APIA|nr:hypothetical protein POM88_045411 [Heracleum sosnowskyi]
MDAQDDIESYLDALKKLYGLLIFNNDRQSVQDHISRHYLLDENARFLLKDLLDGAAEKVLKTASEGHDVNSLNIERVNVEASYFLKSISHLKSSVMQVFYKFVRFIYQVIVSILGLSNKHSLTEQQQSQNSLKTASVFTGLQNTNLIVDKQIDKDKQDQSVDLEQSEACIYAAELWNRKKRCRICRRSSAKQVKFERGTSSAVEIEDTGKETTNLKLKHQADAHEKAIESCNEAISADLSKDSEMQERISGFQFRPRGNGAPVHSYNCDTSGIATSGALQNVFTGTEKGHKDIYCISKEASDAIKSIESCISALKVGGKLVDSRGKQTEPGQGGVFKFATGSVSGIGTSIPNMGDTAALVSLGDPSQVGHFMLGRNDSYCHLVRRRVPETKGLTRWRQLSRYVVNPQYELNLPNQSTRNYASLSPWNAVSRKPLCQNFGKDNEITSRGNTFSQVEELIERQKLGLHKDSSVHFKNVKTNVGKVESMTRTKKSPRRTHSVQGLRIPLNSDKKNSSPDKLPRKTKKLFLDGNLRKGKFNEVGQTKPSVPAVTRHIQTRSKTSATCKVLPRRKIMSQTLRDPVLHGDQMENDRGEVEKINQKGKQRLFFSDQQKSNSGTPSGSSSSSWTTQQGSTSYHDSEKYSVTGHSQSSHHSATSASSESEGNYVCSSTQGHQTGSTSYSYSQLSSVPSSTQSLEYSDSSGEVVGHSHSYQTSSLRSSDPSCLQGHYSRRYRPTIRRPRKRTGRLKKLKDKVAIIFHHHHHHHHYSDDSKHSDDQSQAYHGIPLSKRTAKMFKRRNQAETSGEKATKKLSKSMVHYAPNKKRGSNFNKLVHGLVRHVGHSKKSKKSKGGIEHQEKHQQVSKKLGKKGHWWQLLRRRRRRMKMPKKPRIKLGSGTKKSKLQAVPTIKWR